VRRKPRMLRCCRRFECPRTSLSKSVPGLSFEKAVPQSVLMVIIVCAVNETVPSVTGVAKPMLGLDAVRSGSHAAESRPPAVGLHTDVSARSMGHGAPGSLVGGLVADPSGSPCGYTA
jgi:hypothetical protein